MKLCNLDYLKSVTPKSNAFTIQMIKLFLRDTPVAVNNINEALKNQNWLEVHKNAHKIKPSIIMLGFPQRLIDSLLTIIEHAKTENETHKIARHLFNFEEGIAKVYKELEDAIEEMEN
jgi:hypothetical protein